MPFVHSTLDLPSFAVTATAERSIFSNIGLVAGPFIALTVWGTLRASDSELSTNAQVVAVVGTLMAIWWMTEAIPLAVTALLPLVLFPLLTDMEFASVAKSYASKFIFLFLGGFLIALAMERWNLHRRIALTIVSSVGSAPARLIGGFMLATAALSMWISNTATTVMMLPMAVSMIDLLSNRWHAAVDVDHNDDPTQSKRVTEAIRGIDNFSASLLLGVAYAASIGGVATIVGTPPNTYMADFLTKQGIAIDFAQWMTFALPLSVVFLIVTWLLLTKLLYPVRVREIPGGSELIASELAKLGRLSAGERAVLVVFVLTALAWITRGWLTKWTWLVTHAEWIKSVDDTMIALVAAISLFLIPVDWRCGTMAMNWETARRMPYDILLLFGGGLSLAGAVGSTGLANWICEGIVGVNIPSVILMILLVATVVIFLTELSSNLTTAMIFMPLLFEASSRIAIHDTTGIDPLYLIIPTGLAASCAFMLPVATPPNAVVYGSGKLRIGHMVRAGFVLNLISIVLVTMLVYWLAPIVFTIGSN